VAHADARGGQVRIPQCFCNSRYRIK
jgi:hypothetical protein